MTIRSNTPYWYCWNEFGRGLSLNPIWRLRPRPTELAGFGRNTEELLLDLPDLVVRRNATSHTLQVYVRLDEPPKGWERKGWDR